ncbi:hypothetical protein ABZ362_26425 [Streptomyces sp. NPDC005951]|uniref:hypothetical protein n=1 Tax=Streptomyces sp. NPDC005951 TaxID=3154573 RepID=UPI0033E2F778
MDATEAALVGALGGAVLGAAGAWGAALIALRAARYQADRQADAQQQQWLRQVRRETYRSFLEAAEASKSHLHIASIVGGLPALTEDVLAEKQLRRNAAAEGLHQFQAARAALNLEAPPDIRNLANELSQAYVYVVTSAAWNPPMVGREDLRAEENSARIERVQQLIEQIEIRCRDSLISPQ